jgi:hypothetical protein
MSREEIEVRLLELRKQHPSVFLEAQYEVVDVAETGDAVVESAEAENTLQLALDAD